MNQEKNPESYQAHRNALFESQKERGARLVKTLMSTLERELISAEKNKQSFTTQEVLICASIFLRNVCCLSVEDLRQQIQAIERQYAAIYKALPSQCLSHRLACSLAQLHLFCMDANAEWLDCETEKDLGGLKQ